jgi:hypothetical protein
MGNVEYITAQAIATRQTPEEIAGQTAIMFDRKI